MKWSLMFLPSPTQSLTGYPELFFQPLHMSYQKHYLLVLCDSRRYILELDHLTFLLNSLALQLRRTLSMPNHMTPLALPLQIPNCFDYTFHYQIRTILRTCRTSLLKTKEGLFILLKLLILNDFISFFGIDPEEFVHSLWRNWLLKLLTNKLIILF